MFRLVFVPIICVSVFCGHEALSATVTGTAVRLDCLAEMNAVREAAGLAAFGNATANEQVLPEHPVQERAITAEDLWAEICQKMTGGEVESTEAQQLQGTFAYYPGNKDCKAAVQYWKDGFSLFKNELPPKYTQSSTPTVYTDKAVSFVALYNPQSSPLASCAFVTCTKGGTFASPEALKNQNGRSTRRLQAAQETTTAVVCLTNPEALTEGQPPFKEDVWQKIVQAIVGTQESNGIPPVKPPLALGLIMLLFAYSVF